MNKPKVSIIMPSLNVVDYIEECIASVVNQTLESLEIICIDAGSVDGTREILQSYAERDARITLLHSDKRSYGHQVNMGFKAAAGEYIGIVETDDYIAPDMVEKLYWAAQKNNWPDVVKAGYYSLWEKKGGIKETEKTMLLREEIDHAFPITEHPELIIGHPSIWSCIYKKAYLDTHKIDMKEEPGGGWVDNLFLFRTMCETTQIAWVNEPLYYYRKSNPNASSVLMDCGIPFKRINDIKDYLEKAYPDNRLYEKYLFYRFRVYIDDVRNNPNLKAEDKRLILKTLVRFRPYLAARGLLSHRYRKIRKRINKNKENG